MGLAAHVSPETLTSFDEKAGAVARNTPRNRRLSGDSWRARAASHGDKKFRDISRAVRVPKEHRSELLTRTLQISSAKIVQMWPQERFPFLFFFFFPIFRVSYHFPTKDASNTHREGIITFLGE